MPSGAHYTVELTTAPSEAEIQRVRDGLSQFNRCRIGDKGYLSLAVRLLDEERSFCGGLTAYISYQWLFVDLLWVAEHLRREGHGRRLLLAAEMKLANAAASMRGSIPSVSRLGSSMKSSAMLFLAISRTTLPVTIDTFCGKGFPPPAALHFAKLATFE